MGLDRREPGGGCYTWPVTSAGDRAARSRGDDATHRTGRGRGARLRRVPPSWLRSTGRPPWRAVRVAMERCRPALGTLTIGRSLVDSADGGYVEKDTKTHAARRIALDASMVKALRAHKHRQAERALDGGVRLDGQTRGVLVRAGRSRPVATRWRHEPVRAAPGRAGAAGREAARPSSLRGDPHAGRRRARPNRVRDVWDTPTRPPR